MAKASPVEKTVRVGSLRLDIRQYADGRYGFDFTPPGEERIKVRRTTSERRRSGPTKLSARREAAR